MKRILLLLLLPALLYAAGVTINETNTDTIDKIVFAWTSDSTGTVTGTTTARYTGSVGRVIFDPGTVAPSDNYDVAIYDQNSYDILKSRGYNKDSLATSQIDSMFSAVANSKLMLVVVNAGDSTSGVVTLYIIPTTSDESISSVSDTTGLKTLGKLYYYTGDSTLYIGTGTGLSQIAVGTGDISSVTAGAGLSGGGNSGAVSLAVDTSEVATQYDLATVQIDSTNLAASSVQSSDIKDGQIVNADINASAAIDGNKLASSGITYTQLDTTATGVVDVRKFGAVGDGVTNDWDSVQSALLYTHLHDKTLYFPAGTYLCNKSGNASLYILPGGRIRGEGRNSIIKRTVGIGSMLTCPLDSLHVSWEQNNFEIRDISFDQAGAGLAGGATAGTPTDSLWSGVYLTWDYSGGTKYLGRVLIDNVYVRDTSREAILVWGANHCTINNCVVINGNFHAYNSAKIKTLIFTNNIADSCIYGQEYYGVNNFGGAYDADQAVIVNNTFTNMKGYGITISGGHNILCSNNTLKSLVLSSAEEYSAPSYGMDIYQYNGYSTNFKNTKITNNLIDGFGVYGLRLEWSSGDSSSGNFDISGNTIINSGAKAVLLKAEDSLQLNNFSFVGNTVRDWGRLTAISGPAHSGVTVKFIDSVLIANNKINVSNSLADQVDPIYLESTTGAIVINNDFTGPRTNRTSGYSKRINQHKLSNGTIAYNNIGVAGLWNASTGVFLSTTWPSEYFYNAADSSVAMVFYNTTLARVDTVFMRQP